MPPLTEMPRKAMLLRSFNCACIEGWNASEKFKGIFVILFGGNGVGVGQKTSYPAEPDVPLDGVNVLSVSGWNSTVSVGNVDNFDSVTWLHIA